MGMKLLTTIAEKLHSRSLQSLCGLSQQHNCLMVIGISPNLQDVVSVKLKYSFISWSICHASIFLHAWSGNTYAVWEMQLKQNFSSNILVLLKRVPYSIFPEKTGLIWPTGSAAEYFKISAFTITLQLVSTKFISYGLHCL